MVVVAWTGGLDFVFLSLAWGQWLSTPPHRDLVWKRRGRRGEKNTREEEHVKNNRPGCDCGFFTKRESGLGIGTLTKVLRFVGWCARHPPLPPEVANQ